MEFVWSLSHWIVVIGRVFGRDMTEVKCPSCHIILRAYILNMTCHCQYWPWTPGCGHVCQVSPLSGYSFPPDSILCFTLWKEDTMCGPHLREIMLSLLESIIHTKYLEFFCMGDLPFLPHLIYLLFTIDWFIQYLYQHGSGIFILHFGL